MTGDRRSAMNRKRLALYPGCLVLQRLPQYELATRRVLGELDVDVLDLAGAICCGAPVLESFSDEWVYLGAYNLALAEQLGVDILTICGSCTNSLKRAGLALCDPEVHRRVTERLAALGLTVSAPGPAPASSSKATGAVQVQHLLQVLTEEAEGLRQRIVRPLRLRAALSYPCQVFRPAAVAAFDDPLQPHAMHDLVALTGAGIVETGVEHDCCGASYLMADEAIALAAGRRKIQTARSADVLVDACGNCHLLLERMQKAICDGQAAERLPVLLLPQLLGLAMGLAPQELGLTQEPARAGTP